MMNTSLSDRPEPCAQTAQNHHGPSKSKSPAETAELFEAKEEDI
jgi:hypothetical protein